MKPRQGSYHMGSCHMGSYHMGTPWQQPSQRGWRQPAPGLWGHSCTPIQPSRHPPEGAWTLKEAPGVPPG